MHVFDLEKEQEFDTKKHVEKILKTVGGGDVTVACWEPGQKSPNHCHPDATEMAKFMNIRMAKNAPCYLELGMVKI